MSVINGGSEPAKHESLLPELDSPTSKTKPLSPNKSSNKATKGGDSGEQHANSMMVMKDVTKRHSFGSNLLASLEERLDFDQAVGDAEAAKKINTKDYQNIGHVDAKLIHAGGESKDSPRSSAGRKSSEHNYKSSNRDGSKFKPSKPKMAPPGPGPKPRDIPKFSDPPMYHKSNNKPKYTEPPKYKQVEPPSQNMDRGAPPPMQSMDRGGRPTNEPPKQPKINRPKIEPPKPKAEISKPKMQPPKSPDAIDSPRSPRTPKLDQARPKFQPPRQPSSRPSMDPPPPQPTKPSSPRRQPKREPSIDKEQLLPSLGAVGAVSKARSQTLPATPHDNVSLEIKEEKVSNVEQKIQSQNGHHLFDEGIVILRLLSFYYKPNKSISNNQKGHPILNNFFMEPTFTNKFHIPNSCRHTLMKMQYQVHGGLHGGLHSPFGNTTCTMMCFIPSDTS